MSTMEITESALLHCLSLSLRPSDSVHSLPSLTEQEWAQVLALADRHEVLPLLETVLGDVELPPALRSAMEWKTAGTVHQSLQLQAKAVTPQLRFATHNPVCTPRVLASRRALGRLAEGGLMPRRCRGIRGDEGIAPYGRSPTALS